ncbi:hypothetical protein J4455_00945 [Candidatus Woesearchaeota archaeon]|nr:hypothetical protein [Candidatus Woesearchaeota archaeon]
MKKIVIVFGIILSLIFSLNLVYACSCATGLSVEGRYQTVDAIFIGKVTKIDRPAFSISSADPIIVTFDVSKSYKGTANKNFELETTKESASCGYPFNEEGEYLVYATLNEGKYETNLCSGTAELADAKEDLQILNNLAGKDNNFVEEPIDKGLDLSQVMVMALLVLIIALLIIAEMHIASWIKGKKKKVKKHK